MIRVMEPFDAYRFYQSLKLHFESKTYDAAKYNFKTSASPKSFWKRNDKYHFAKVAKRFKDQGELVGYYASHFVNGTKWVGEMLTQDEVYQSWLKRMQSISYIFEQDLNHLSINYESFDDLLMCKDGQHPDIVTAYLQDEISLETVVIINKLTGFMKRADKQITETILWPDISLKIRKYEPFVKVNPDKMKKIVLKVFTS
jgi:hypothetical protein